MIKQLSFVRRSTGVQPDEFGRLWIEETRESVATMPAHARPRRLAHCVVRQGRQPLDHDGVAISWHDGEAALTGYGTWLADQRSSAVDVTAATVVRVEERTVFGDAWLEERWRQPATAPQLLLIGLIEPVEGMTRTDFGDYWWSNHRPLANRLVPTALQPVAYVHDYLLPDEPTRWAGVGEMYEASLDIARQRGAWFAGEAAAALIADEDRFLVRNTRQLLITDQHLIINEGEIA